jgi:stage III sporulation protein AA
LRSLSPQYILCDEIGAQSEISAIESGISSGVKFICTVHAGGFDDLNNRPQIRALMEIGEFKTVALLEGMGRVEGVYEIQDGKAVLN